MEICNDNVEEISNLYALIDDCDFISMDTELTGLADISANFYDNPDQRYTFTKDHSMNYTITQFGICIFKFNEKENCFSYLPINFYVKPFGLDQITNKNFLINSGTIEFLNKNNFDYNRTWKEGIAYISHEEYDDNIKIINLKRDHELEKLNSNIDLHDFSHLDNLIKDCFNLLSDTSEDSKLQIDVPQDSYTRFLILNLLWKKVGIVNNYGIHASIQKMELTNKNYISIVKLEDVKENMTKLIMEKYNGEKEKIDQRYLFTKFIKHISESKKTLVAHNSFLDINHTINGFIQPLPPAYSDFKKLVNSLFPKIFDTKFMFCDDRFKSMRAFDLENIYKLTLTEPFLNPKEMIRPFSEEFTFQSNNSFHTAHFDAMITGSIFISLVTFIGNNSMGIWTNFRSDTPKILKKFLNKVSVVKAEFNWVNLEPNSIEKEHSRKNVFHLTIPTQWNKCDLIEYLSKLLKKPPKLFYEQMDMRWLGNKSLMVKMPQSVNLGQELKDPTLSEWKDEAFKVTILSFYKYTNLDDPRQADADGFCQLKKRKR